MIQMTRPIEVFYDGKCGLCRREISFYRKIAPIDRFLWVDISQSPEALHALGIGLAEGLKNLHVRDGQGRILTGVDAFILIWKGLPGFNLLAPLAGLPLIKPALTWAYARFADWHYKHMGYDRCDL
jgi:predicted DCC family thiol-disulfide oxidoreductase YuxK